MVDQVSFVRKKEVSVEKKKEMLEKYEFKKYADSLNITTKSGRLIKDKYFPEDKKQAIAATAVKLLSNGSVLNYVGKTNMVLSQARKISKIMKEKDISHP